MPRIPANTTLPDYQEVERDVKRFGPMTRQYAESVAVKMGWRHPNGDKLAYNTRRSRGVDYLHGLLFRGEATVTEVARKVYSFHLDRAQAAELADVTPFYGYK